MFATGSLARRIERADATLIADGAAAASLRLPSEDVTVVPLAGGVAAFLEPGSPFNKIAGLGFDGPPDEAQLEAFESAVARQGAPVQVELASLGLPDVARLFTRRGYELVGFENVLGLSLDDRTLERRRRAAGESAIEVKRAGTGESRAWMDTVTSGFLNPDTFDGPPSHESFDRAALEGVYRDVIAAPSFTRYLARRNGTIAGGASLRLFEGVAQLCGAATLPDHRRQGVHTAMLDRRLLDAAEQGCDVAVMTTEPGSKSQQNAQRFGFSVLYVRAVLVKSERPS